MNPGPKTGVSKDTKLTVLGGGAFVVIAAIIAAWATLHASSSSLAPTNPSTGAPQIIGTTIPKATITTSPQIKFNNAAGWGPGRRTFTMKAPSSYPVFNSITDEPQWGDERSFVSCHDAADSYWATDLVARDGHTYHCALWFDNSISPSLDTIASPLSGGNPAAELQNARVAILLPSSPLYNPSVVGELSADNAITVWSSCDFVSPRAMMITYVRGSARLVTKPIQDAGLPDGLVLAETYNGNTMVNGITALPGSLLGGSSQDGFVGQHPGYVNFDVKVTLSQ